MEGNDSLGSDDADWMEVEIDVDEEELIDSDEDSDISETNEVDNLLDQVNDLSDGGTDSDMGTSVSNMSQNDSGNSTGDLTDDVTEDNMGSPDNGQNPGDDLAIDPEWNRVFKPIHVNQFRGQLGSNLPPDFDISSNPVNYFQLFLMDDVISTICENMNKYRKFRCEQKRTINHNYQEKHWEDVNIHCMKAYIGLSIYFGILNQLRYRSYWSSDESAVKSVFTLRRYQKMSEYLHVSDHKREIPQGHVNYDKFGRICWLIEHFLTKFPKFYLPQCEQTCDEGLVRYGGHCSFLQYNAKKPIKWGITIWKCCDSVSIYCQEFEIYLGKSSKLNSKFGPIFDTVW